MEKGVKATGEAITYQGRSRYSPAYAKKKGKSSPIDLKDTGSFHRKTYAEVLADDIEFSSTDAKTKMLEERSGEDIFGLTTQSKSIVQEQGMDMIITETETILRL